MPLSDDQKAMLRLLAQREQGYDDLAALMGLSVDEVRAKVKDALEQLEAEGETPPPVPPEPTPAEEPPVPAEPPTAAESPAPEAPAEPVAAEPPSSKTPEAEKPAAAAKASIPVAKRTPPSRPRITLPDSGGARAAIAAGLAVLVAAIVVLAVSGGGGSSDSTTTAASGTSSSEEASSTTPANSKLTQAVLTPVSGGGGKGVAIFGRIKKNVVLQVQAEGLEPSPKGSSYTIWLYKSPKLALRVGSVNVTKSGGIAAQLPLPTELLAYVASGAFDQIDVSLTANAAYEAEIAKAKKEKRLPAYTGTDVLRGKVTGPAIR